MTVTKNNERLLVCNCRQSMEIDAAALARSLGLPDAPKVHRELCRMEVAAFRDALGGEQRVHVACTQEAPLFREVAEDAGADGERLVFTNIRERAGWCDAASAATPKIAALLADARYQPKPASSVTLKSDGVCLVYGRGQQALDVAGKLNGRLSVSVVLLEADDAIPPARNEVPIYKGRIKTLSGHLGKFDVEVDGYAPMLPFSRGGLEFAMARDGARSTCDMVIDLSGSASMLREPERRDGYFHVDPRNAAAVAEAIFTAADLVGEFEKPLYVDYDASICAHARSGKVGCRNCLDACPLGAITPDGDTVAIDHMVCAGCGNCSAVCPTGAVSYALPGREGAVARAQLLLSTYFAAGGAAPVMLLHDEAHGEALISAMARYGRGLPPNVIPLALNVVTGIGHETASAMLACGAAQIVVLASPRRMAELPALQSQVELVSHILNGLGHGEQRLYIAAEDDPDVVERLLWALPALEPAARHSFTPTGSKREFARVALAAIREAAPLRVDMLALPAGAPYGRIVVDTDGCTLCLSCVGACPANALGDNPERPELSFTEAACVQCGVCVSTCPESAITLEPRFDFTSRAMNPLVVKGEEPFECVACGKPFGAKSSIERVVERLKGHSMFQGEDKLQLIQMCENCRVIKISEQGDDPFKGGARPAIRTTDDYLAEAADRTSSAAPGAKPARKPDDFIN